MTDDRFRMRVDTGCTGDSKDSGIDVQSRLRNVPKRLHRRDVLKTVMEDADEAKWDIDTVLWAIVFALTVWFFRLPTSIWFSRKVNWPLATLSILCFSIFSSCGLWMYWKYRTTARWRILNPYVFAAAWIAFAAGIASFSASTWSLFGWWSLYIAGVTMMFLISIAPLFS
ncbi:unnamed protein product [Cylicocyclus nassatus]|uniref:Uncharacterized protein n=1 Tax=Cylicocyclus nassatus TaxID=53992 RepID=A0AA36HEI4_CYLNA|nr:unnamed protein product [Cylicocyclus nassatus]